MGVFELLGSVLMVLGCVLSLTGSVGALRMPDFYSRLHPAGKTDTLGQILILSGLASFAAQRVLEALLAEDPATGEAIGYVDVLLKVLLLSFLLLVTAPTATHAIAKAARLDPETDIPVEGDPAQKPDPQPASEEPPPP